MLYNSQTNREVTTMVHGPNFLMLAETAIPLIGILVPGLYMLTKLKG